MHDVIEGVGERTAREQRVAGERAVGDRRERVKIGAVIDGSSSRLLGCHVRGRPDDLACRESVAARENARDAEVEDLPGGAGEEQVLRLEVTVDHADRHGGGDACANLPHEIARKTTSPAVTPWTAAHVVASAIARLPPSSVKKMPSTSRIGTGENGPKNGTAVHTATTGTYQTSITPYPS